jgi:hypothetical protein
LRRLVLTHTLERCLAQQAIAGPIAEMRFDDHFRLDPLHVRAAGFSRRNPVERCLHAFQGM